MNRFLFSVILILAGCTPESQVQPVAPVADFSPTAGSYADRLSFTLQEGISNGKREKADRITFGVKVVSAETFARRVSGTDPVEEGLSDETVVMLEIALPNASKDLFESPRILMTRDEAGTYFSGGIQQDIAVEQDGKTHTANGVSYEGRSMSNQKVRLLCFFKGIDPQKPAQIRYYDRLFGLGLMKFNIHEPSAL
jgi:hypothetical protein